MCVIYCKSITRWRHDPLHFCRASLVETFTIRRGGKGKVDICRHCVKLIRPDPERILLVTTAAGEARHEARKHRQRDGHEQGPGGGTAGREDRSAHAHTCSITRVTTNYRRDECHVSKHTCLLTRADIDD